MELQTETCPRGNTCKARCKKKRQVNWPERRMLVQVVVLDIKICKDDNSWVGGQEDSDVPHTMQVGEPYTGPVGAEKSEYLNKRQNIFYLFLYLSLTQAMIASPQSPTLLLARLLILGHCSCLSIKTISTTVGMPSSSRQKAFTTFTQIKFILSKERYYRL